MLVPDRVVSESQKLLILQRHAIPSGLRLVHKEQSKNKIYRVYFPPEIQKLIGRPSRAYSIAFYFLNSVSIRLYRNIVVAFSCKLFCLLVAVLGH